MSWKVTIRPVITLSSGDIIRVIRGQDEPQILKKTRSTVAMVAVSPFLPPPVRIRKLKSHYRSMITKYKIGLLVCHIHLEFRLKLSGSRD